MGRECLSRLYIGHLPANTLEDDFRSFLLTEGQLARNSFSITVKKGYAFMQCCDQATADRVIDRFNGAPYLGSILSIEPALSNFPGAPSKLGRCLMTVTNVPNGSIHSDTPGTIEDFEKILATWGGNVLSMEKLGSSKYIVTVADAQAMADLVAKCHGMVSNGLTVSAEIAPDYLKVEDGSGDAREYKIAKVQQTEVSSTSPTTSTDECDKKVYGSRSIGTGTRAYYRGPARTSGEFRRYSDPNPTFPWRMLIPSTQVGALIGRGGATIRAITQATGTRINIHTGPGSARSRGDAEKVVRIIGSPEGCTTACRKILEILAKDLSKWFGAELALRLVAYDSLIGRVIGKGGVNITKIMHESNTRIHISNVYETRNASKYRHNDCDRIITIRGSIGGMIQAEALVLQKLRTSFENDMLHPLPRSVPVDVNVRPQY